MRLIISWAPSPSGMEKITLNQDKKVALIATRTAAVFSMADSSNNLAMGDRKDHCGISARPET
jgi:hypothetical protein